MKRAWLLPLACIVLPASAGEFPSRLPKVPDPEYLPKRGDHAVLAGYSAKHGALYAATVCTYSFVYEEYWKALDIDDDDGVQELRDKKQVIRLDIGTEVLVLEIEEFPEKDARADAAVVRIMSGPFKGRKMWAAAFNVVHLVDNPDYKPNSHAQAKPKEDADRPQSRTPSLDETPAGILKRARDFDAKGDIPSAKLEYRLLIRTFPKSTEAVKTAPRLKELDDRDATEKAAKETGQKAARELAIARNLEKTGKKKAALAYYRAIVKKYPETDAAKTAAARIEGLEAK